MHFREFDVMTLPRNQKSKHWIDVAERVDGGMWQLPLLTITGANDGPTLVVTAAVHGDEYEGVEAVPRVFAQIEPEDLSGTLVMMSVCNMPAFEARTRSSPVDGKNLARVFPGNENGTLTQVIAHWIRVGLIRHADFYIDLHSGGVASEIPTLIGYMHSHTEAIGKQSRAGAEAFGAPVLWGHPLPANPGRTIRTAIDYGVPCLYTEAPGGGFARPDDVDCFVNGVINVMKHLMMLEGEPQPQPKTHDLLGHGDLDTIIAASQAGYFRPHVTLLDDVKTGDRLGTVYDLVGDPLDEIVADRDGVVILLRRLHFVQPGDGLVHLTGYYNEG